MQGTKTTAVAIVVILTIAASGLVSVLAPSVADCQTPDDRRKAKQAFREARKAYAAKKYDHAAEKFKEAYDFDPKAGLLFNIGQALSESGNFAEALQFFQRYLAERPDAKNAAVVEKSIAELQELVNAAGVSVMIQGETEGLPVFIDGETEQRCVTPCMVSLPTGPHTISVTGDGLEMETKEVELEIGGTETVRFAPKPLAKLGAFRIRTTIPSGEVRVDGSHVAELPMNDPIELEAGTYSISIVQEGELVWSGSVAVESAKTVEVSATVADNGGVGIMTITAIALGGAGLVSIGAGALFGLAASDAESSLSTQLDRGEQPDSDMIDQGENDALFANIFYAVGLVAIGTGITLYLLDDTGESQPPAEPSGVTLLAAPAPGGGSVVLGWHF